MPRLSTQIGQLFANGTKSKRPWWAGRFRVRVKTAHGEKAVRKTKFLGWQDEMTKTQAMNKMTEEIRNAHDKFNNFTMISASSEPGILSSIGMHAKGDIAEMLVSIDLMKRGFEVFTHACEFASCDMVAMRDGKFARIEVKYCGGVTPRYQPTDKFDILAVVRPDQSIEYQNEAGKKFACDWPITVNALGANNEKSA